MFSYKGSTALVTGASGGLGESFAQQLAQRGCNLVLVARSEDKLRTLARRLERQCEVKATVVVADLASAGATERIVVETRESGIDIDLLINNAGFGVFKRFLESPIERQMDQIDVNLRTPVLLTYAFVPGMVARGRGGVINVSSSAGFQPVAGANIYAASKSFLLLFSEALAQELAGSNVRIMAACPGPVATTFFADKNPAIGRDEMDIPESIVREVLRAFDKGKRVLVPGKFSVRMNAFAVRLLSRTLTARIAEGMTRSLNRK